MHPCLKHLRFAIGICFFFSQAHGASDSSLSTPKVIAVQSRPYPINNEITLQGGYMPLDSFNRYVNYGGSFTHFFNSYEGWEALNIVKAINYDTGLGKQLQKSFTVSTYPFDTLDYFITTNFIYTPFFNKSLLMDSTIVRGETSVVIGGGMAKFDSGFTDEVDAGILYRFFWGPSFSLKFDFRYHFYFSSTANNNLQLGAGISYAFGSSEPSAKDLEKEKAEKEKDHG